MFSCRLLNHKISNPNRGPCSFVPRAQASSRYANERVRLETKCESTSLLPSLTGDVIYDLAEDDCKRSWVTVSAERTTIILHSLACTSVREPAPQTKLNSGYVRLQNSAEILGLGPPPVYPDLSTRNDWLVKNAIVDFPVSMEENSKLTSCDFVESIRGTERGSRRSSADVTSRG